MARNNKRPTQQDVDDFVSSNLIAVIRSLNDIRSGMGLPPIGAGPAPSYPPPAQPPIQPHGGALVMPTPQQVLQYVPPPPVAPIAPGRPELDTPQRREWLAERHKQALGKPPDVPTPEMQRSADRRAARERELAGDPEREVLIQNVRTTDPTAPGPSEKDAPAIEVMTGHVSVATDDPGGMQ